LSHRGLNFAGKPDKDFGCFLYDERCRTRHGAWARGLLWYCILARWPPRCPVKRRCRNNFHHLATQGERFRLTEAKSVCFSAGVVKAVNEQRDARLLIAEDEANLRLVLQKELQRLGYRVHVAPDGEAALRKLEESNVDVLLCDINMPRMDGMELLRRVHERPNPPEVIMLTGQGTIETAVEAMRTGAYDYLTKPYSINELDVRVRQAAEKRRLRTDHQRLRA